MPPRSRTLAVIAASVLQFAWSCTAPETQRGVANTQAEFETSAEPAVEEAELQPGTTSESAALCRITHGNEAAAKARLPQQFRVGELVFHAERGALLCSEPAGLGGDCQIIRGRTVIVARAGQPDIRVEAIAAAPYLIYGPDGVRCSPPAPPVRR